MKSKVGEPDPINPEYQDIIILWKKKWLSTKAVVIIPDRLYVVAEDNKEDGVFEGEIFVSNLELTQRNGFDPEIKEEWNYMRYRNIYDAIRGLGIVNKKYQQIEIPDLETWQRDLQTLVLLTIDLKKGISDPYTYIFEGLVGEVVAMRQWLRDPNKLKARQLTTELNLVDSLGRFNPGRLPLKTFSAKDALSKRRNKIGRIGLKMDERVVVLAAYNDAAYRHCEQIQLAIKRLLNDKKIFGPNQSEEVMKSKAEKIREYAESLSRIHIRPFGPWAYRHTANDLLLAAEALEEKSPLRASLPLMVIADSMHLVALRRQMERALLLVSRAIHLDQALAKSAWKQLKQFLEELNRDLRAIKKIQRFKIIKSVCQNMDQAIYSCDCREKDLKKSREKDVHSFLKRACKPI